MADERRTSQRINVSIKMSCPAADSDGLRLHDMSSGGFLASGRVALEVGEPMTASVHLFPASGECMVGLRGTVMRAFQDGDHRVIGVRIDGFESGEGEKAYHDYVRELEADM